MKKLMIFIGVILVLFSIKHDTGTASLCRQRPSSRPNENRNTIQYP